MPRAAFLGELLMPRLIPAVVLTLACLYVEASPAMSDAPQPPPEPASKLSLYAYYSIRRQPDIGLKV